MAQIQRKRKKGKRKGGKVILTQRARLVEKNDKTRVSRFTPYPVIQGRPPANVGATFKIKIRRK